MWGEAHGRPECHGEVPDGWQLVRWERSAGGWGGGTVVLLGLHHGAWEVDPEEPWAAVPTYMLDLSGRYVYAGDRTWTPCTSERFESLADAVSWAATHPLPH